MWQKGKARRGFESPISSHLEYAKIKSDFGMARFWLSHLEHTACLWAPRGPGIFGWFDNPHFDQAYGLTAYLGLLHFGFWATEVVFRIWNRADNSSSDVRWRNLSPYQTAIWPTRACCIMLRLIRPLHFSPKSDWLNGGQDKQLDYVRGPQPNLVRF